MEAATGVKKRTRKNKQTKTAIVFDAEARKDFLTGFRKRKNERRRKAKEQLQRELQEEIKRAREKARNRLERANEFDRNHSVLPDIEHLLPSVVNETKTHTVSVTHIDSLASINSSRGQSDEKDDAGDGDGSCVTAEQEEKKSNTVVNTKKSMSKANKVYTKTLNRSKAFKACQKQQKSKKSSKLKSKKTAKSKRTKHHNPKKNTTTNKK